MRYFASDDMNLIQKCRGWRNYRLY